MWLERCGWWMERCGWRGVDGEVWMVDGEVVEDK